MADGKWKMEKTRSFPHLPFAIYHQAGPFFSGLPELRPSRGGLIFER
jgi:hypothetical protein